ncbi:MAG: hypothetical protein L6Q52_00895 [Rhodocyclaceae bacterium]|nr:hypothetical protein [Rhodocyclaceae bacterium]
MIAILNRLKGLMQGATNEDKAFVEAVAPKFFQDSAFRAAYVECWRDSWREVLASEEAALRQGGVDISALEADLLIAAEKRLGSILP